MGNILVVGETRGNSVKKVTLEILTAAKRLAGQLGGSVQVALLGGGGLAALAGPLGEAGADEVLVAESGDLQDYAVESYTDAIQQIVDQSGATLILLGATPRGRDLGPRVAARLGAGLASDVTDITVEGSQVVVTRPVFAGKAIASVALQTSPAVVTVRPNSFPVPAPQAGKSAKVTPVAVTIEYAPGARVVEFQQVQSSRPELTEASIIVSGGRGMGAPEHFDKIEALADVLGAAVGASRAVVDAGWRPHSDQVGQTGKTVSPTLYIACGISGAIQHLAGMRTSKYIVAINKDPEAPIFKVADYGIVGDVFSILPMLTEEAKKVKA